MSWLWTVLGIAVLSVTFLDLLLVSLGANGLSIASDRIARLVWRGLSGRLRRGGPTLHRVTGPIVMIAAAAFWVFGSSLGWTLIFFASEASVVASPAAPPDAGTGFWSDWAYAGHMLSTLGGGLTSPGNLGWAVLSVFAGITGMVVLTLAVSFTLTTSETVTAGRAFCTRLDLKGASAVARSDDDLIALAALVASLNSAPLALYYSSPDPSWRLSDRMAGLIDLAADDPDGRLAGILSHVPGMAGDAPFAKRAADWRRIYALDRADDGTDGEAAA